MASQRHFTTQRILAIVLGVILFGIIIAMRLAPPDIRDDSGEAYITIACLLAIGSGLLYYGLSAIRPSEQTRVQTDSKR
jgi:prolipoprotein diacylglyceryltransferase